MHKTPESLDSPGVGWYPRNKRHSVTRVRSAAARTCFAIAEWYFRRSRSEERSMKSRQTWIASAIFILLVVSAARAGAQELRGRLAGVVTDNSGAVLPGATITASSPALIQPQTTTSGADGAYRFPALPSELYSLTFALQGF